VMERQEKPLSHQWAGAAEIHYGHVFDDRRLETNVQNIIDTTEHAPHPRYAHM